MSLNSQQTLVRALQDPAVYPHPADRLQLIETHISWVILCGDYAYKIKKGVDLGFLDFSSLEKRKFFCREELRLNGRLAPTLYLELVPITGTAEQPQLGGPGEAFEYAVKMRRFPQDTLLSRIVAAGRLQASHVDQMIAQVTAFHHRIPVAAAGSRFGSPECVGAPAQENFIRIREQVDDSRQLALLDAISRWAEREYERCREHFQQRQRHGFIRECHGDMHLGNMALVDDRLLIFDGIEFNPELYWIDVMSEVAFLCMDLEDHAQRPLAFRFLNGYLEATGDYAGIRVLRYYLVYRAVVRAKVASIRLQQTAGADSAAPAALEFARYLQLAASYTQPPAPVLLITHGLSGSGKSTHTAPLCEQLGAIRIRSDSERQRLFGRGGDSDQAVRVGHGVYGSDATRQTYTQLAELAAGVLASGYPVIVDAAFLERWQRDLFAQLADRLAVPHRILCFGAAGDVLRQRIRLRQREGADISEAGLSVLERQLQGYEGLGEDEQAFAVVIDSGAEPSADDILARVRQSLAP